MKTKAQLTEERKRNRNDAIRRGEFRLATEPYMTYEVFEQMKIYEIVFEETPDQITLHIRLARPGLLIGKAGHIIDGIKTQLANDWKKKVWIDVQEWDLWDFYWGVKNYDSIGEF